MTTRDWLFFFVGLTTFIKITCSKSLGSFKQVEFSGCDDDYNKRNISNFSSIVTILIN